MVQLNNILLRTSIKFKKCILSFKIVNILKKFKNTIFLENVFFFFSNDLKRYNLKIFSKTLECSEIKSVSR